MFKCDGFRLDGLDGIARAIAIAFPSRIPALFSEAILAHREWSKMAPEARKLRTPAQFAIEAKRHGKTARQIRKRIAEGQVERHKEKCSKQAAHRLAKHPLLAQRCHNEDCLVVLRKIAEAGTNPIRVMWADVPYANYDKTGDQSHPPDAGSYVPMRYECANASGPEAIALTLGIIDLAPQVLMARGVLLLWQAGLKFDRPEIIKRIQDLGMTGWGINVRKKGQQPGDFNDAQTYSSERLLVIFREGENPIDLSCGTLPRTDFLDTEQIEAAMNKLDLKWPTRSYSADVRAGRRELGDSHIMQKPESLCGFWIEKYSAPGELVVDVCGCSGSFCTAAERMGRNWIYCEKERVTFDWGVSRIMEAAAEAAAA